MIEEKNTPEENNTEESTTSPMNSPAVDTEQTSNVVQQNVADIKTELNKVLIGMDNAIEETLAALFTNSHVLLEGFPGVAKTLLVKLLSQAISVDFKRIQFTPDLMPSDVLGTMVFDQKNGDFSFHKGPIFTNFVLIDEINRSPAKTQSALFEVMEERQITMEGTTYPLAYPFLVIGTQNPIDQEGTYRLPEAQLDRFVFKIKVPYPNAEDELAILERFQNDFDRKIEENVSSILNKDSLKECENYIQQIHIDKQILGYITQIIQATRNHQSIYLGASPRASLAIMRVSKAFAAMAGRNFVKPDDVQRACHPVLNHRLIPSATAEMEGFTTNDIIESILEDIEVPR
ncbi:MoxR-like ATPase [Owenweeksia hongkongensis DSM 17368]|uniref:MoxR-like ATPase n=1 Tax=Owenweeksia hongkongensis (strain DSM 17368 / CIP 108786 / JCM 12287 / NRRL B-23963 / UST20020801) TaxID=926562 RepID=G8QZ97_OWEHD|nr:MoxR family ATPase [Owenweeksia hongkongensis]AEV31480.1 MoxR-like ATPase [Owenweeksia hongkongensis DSM 17368]